MAVANHPYFATQAAEDDNAARQTVFRVIGQPLKHRLLIVLANVSCNTTQKSLARRVLRHVADVATGQLHGVTAIAAEQAVAILRLAGRTIDDGNEVICDDDSVLAFLRGILWDESLLDNFHLCNFWDTAH